MRSAAARAQTGLFHHVTTLDPNDVELLPWRAVLDCPGVRAKELWHSADTVCALIAYEPDATTPGPAHPDADQHIWVVSGSALVEGRDLPAGSYLHVPPQVAHPITAVGPVGCLLLQVHQRCPR